MTGGMQNTQIAVTSLLQVIFSQLLQIERLKLLFWADFWSDFDILIKINWIKRWLL